VIRVAVQTGLLRSEIAPCSAVCCVTRSHLDRGFSVLLRRAGQQRVPGTELKRKALPRNSIASSQGEFDQKNHLKSGDEFGQGQHKNQ